jgi:hypothetical protein
MSITVAETHSLTKTKEGEALAYFPDANDRRALLSHRQRAMHRHVSRTNGQNESNGMDSGFSFTTGDRVGSSFGNQ